ncbi:MAG: hypothetical protein JO117_04565 [Verrucomicrobia bacterium]|nr:hypothetical protein [Verrucomicrobiota bacterium]MBV9657878.1 hypothetical protein [Verrucomicrobiota bacterium]
MPRSPRDKKKKPSPDDGASPLAARERQLAEQQHQLRAQIEALERSIEDAPRRAAELARREREAMLERSRESGYESRRGGALRDKRHSYSRMGMSGTRRGGRRAVPVLRHERRAQVVKTLALLVVLIVVVGYLFWTYFL